jgi:hypothetical protein
MAMIILNPENTSTADPEVPAELDPVIGTANADLQVIEHASFTNQDLVAVADDIQFHSRKLGCVRLNEITLPLDGFL